MRVLVVEDSSSDVARIRRALANDSPVRYELTVVGSLQDCLQALGQNEFEVLVLDLGLPDSDGLESLTRIKEVKPELPIVVMTNYDEQDRAIGALRLGVEHYVLKSFPSHDVADRTLKLALERLRLRKLLEQVDLQSSLERQFSTYEELSSSSPTPVSSRMLGLGPVRESAPEKFGALVAEYELILTQSLTRQIFRQDDQKP